MGRFRRVVEPGGDELNGGYSWIACGELEYVAEITQGEVLEVRELHVVEKT